MPFSKFAAPRRLFPASSEDPPEIETSVSRYSLAYIPQAASVHLAKNLLQEGYLLDLCGLVFAVDNRFGNFCVNRQHCR